MKRPLGVTVLAGILTFVGGLSSVIIFIEMIDSIRFFGFESIGISSLSSLLGLIIFGGTPVLLYSAGVGLFLSQAWARVAVQIVIPLLLFAYFFNLALTIAYQNTLLWSPSFWDILGEQSDVFFNILFRYTILIGPLIYYFSHPRIVEYFRKAQAS